MAMLAVSSCSEKELEETPVGEDTTDEVVVRNLVEVPCEFIVQPFGNEMTKAKTDPEPYSSNELMIYNFWLLQFDGSDRFQCAIYHEASSSVNGNPYWGLDRVKMSEDHINSTKTVWVVANIGRYAVNGYEYFVNYSGKTLSDFYKDGLPLSEVDQLKLLNGNATCVSDPNVGLPIPLSGGSSFDASQLTGVDDNKALVIRLKSIVAKLTVNASSVAGASSLTLYGVPARVSYAPDYVDKTTFNSLTYEYDVALPSNKTVTLYVPQNKPMVTTKTQAQASSGTAATKTSNAPPKATYFSVGVTANSGKKLAVNIFPGENEKDYNILANTHYKETVSVADGIYTSYLGDTKNDSRLIEHLVETRESNCYMLHPIYQGSTSYVKWTNYKDEAYVLPFVKRVNTAWSGNSSKSIGASDEWVVHLLWQDEPKRLVYFSETSGLPAWQDNASDGDDYAFEFYGKGDENVYIKVQRSTSSNYTRGNVVVALRKKDSNGSYAAANGQKYGDILWSWHLWVTDYQPDDAGAYSSAKGYHSTVKGEDGSRVFHFDFWSNIYHWIMDRNLGAKGWTPALRSNTSASIDNQTSIRATAPGYGLFYQWGRKDPIPANTLSAGQNINSLQLYDITGANISDRVKAESSANSMSMADLHSRPMAMQQNINYAALGGNWASDSANEKSLYDPCPPGWVVPSYWVYRNFVSNLSSTIQDNVNVAYAPKTPGSKFGYGINNYEGFAVDPSGGKGATYAIYFPASGFVGSTGNRDMGGLCDLWALEAKSNDIASYLYIGRPLTGGGSNGTTRGYAIVNVYGPSNFYNKNMAFGMRCVKTNVSNQ